MYTETEMRQFFQSVVDQVAQLSTQAAKVEGLEARINDLSERLRQVEDENANLRRDLMDARAQTSNVQENLNAVSGSLEMERSVSGGLRDTIVQRDVRVAELSHDLEASRNDHGSAVRERDQARNEVSDLEGLVTNLRESLRQTTDDRNNLQVELSKSQSANSDLQTRLDRINSVINPPRPVDQASVA